MAEFTPYGYPADGGYSVSSGGYENVVSPRDPTQFVSTFLPNGLAESVEQLVRKQVEQIVGQMPPRLGGSRSVSGTDNLEMYDPDNSHTDIGAWIVRFDEVGERYGWSDIEKMYILKTKLQGRAREWYTRTDAKCPDFQWEDWKKGLWTAFMRGLDFGAELEEMVLRKKEVDESMSSYFNEKMSLCERCDLFGEKAISCVIRGLPEELRQRAKALNCRAPEDFVKEFVQPYDRRARFSPPAGSHEDPSGFVYIEGKGRDRSPIDMYEKDKLDGVPIAADHKAADKYAGSCHNCKKKGHRARHCPSPKKSSSSVKTCSKCGDANHLRAQCTKAKRSNGSSSRWSDGPSRRDPW